MRLDFPDALDPNVPNLRIEGFVQLCRVALNSLHGLKKKRMAKKKTYIVFVRSHFGSRNSAESKS
jgi:hypothetical protein